MNILENSSQADGETVDAELKILPNIRFVLE